MKFHNAADCHVHIFDSAYPFIENPRYTPDEHLRGSANQLRHLLHAHGLTHALLVAAAPYGGNNRPILDAIRKSCGAFKGIALVPGGDISDRELRELHEGGIVGVRVDLAQGIGELTGPHFDSLLPRMAEMGWFLEIHCKGDELLAAEPILKRHSVRLLVDHIGRPDISAGITQPAFQLLLEWGKAGRAVAKISAPFRFSTGGYPFTDVDDYVAAVIDAYGIGNCVWGSDWPFVNMGERVDFGPPLVCLERWFPDENDLKTVLWDAPLKHFGFTPLSNDSNISDIPGMSQLENTNVQN